MSSEAMGKHTSRNEAYQDQFVVFLASLLALMMGTAVALVIAQHPASGKNALGPYFSTGARTGWLVVALILECVGMFAGLMLLRASRVGLCAGLTAAITVTAIVFGLMDFNAKTVIRRDSIRIYPTIPWKGAKLIRPMDVRDMSASCRTTSNRSGDFSNLEIGLSYMKDRGGEHLEMEIPFQVSDIDGANLGTLVANLFDFRASVRSSGMGTPQPSHDRSACISALTANLSAPNSERLRSLISF